MFQSCDKVHLKRHEKFRGTIELNVHVASLISLVVRD